MGPRLIFSVLFALSVSSIFSFGGNISVARMPAGAILAWSGASCPTFTHLADGSAQSRTGTFANLFAVVGTTYPGAASGSQFNLPDYRGLFLRGVGTNVTANAGSPAENANGAAFAGAALGTLQNDLIQGHQQNLTDPGHGHNVLAGSNVGGGQTAFNSTYNNLGSSVSYISGTPSAVIQASTTGVSISGTVTDGTNGTPRLGAETHPANLSVTYCIWY